MRRAFLLLLVSSFGAIGCLNSGNARANDDLALNGSLLAYKYCYTCHNSDDDYYNIFDHQELVDGKYVVKGDAEQSALWKRLTDQDDLMPPEDEPQPTDAEKKVFKRWIESGAPLVAIEQVKNAAKIAAGGSDLAKRGTALMEKYCYDCHGGKATKAKLDIFAEDLDAKFTGGGDAEKSKIWRLVEAKKMPKRGSPMPSDDEIQVIRQWIDAGYVISRSKVATRPFISVADEIKAIAADVDGLLEKDQPFARYFSLRNVHNNYQRYTSDDLDAHRAALAKVVNSLSWSSRIVPPTPVDAAGTLYRIDLRDYEWDSPEFQRLYGYKRIGVWNLLCSQYPYAVTHENSGEQRIRVSVKDINSKLQLRGQYPVLRADWFCFHATQIETYYLIMGIPANVRGLERALGVNLESDFRQQRLHRFALKESGVSVGNRLMDRHEGRIGAYWISYDFKEGGDRNDLRRYPLGPVYPNHPHARFAFKHDGGEIIFSLPNGMQGYALTDDKGNLLREGPIEVVQDEFQANGDATVTNAISCMKCHAAGMKEFEDDIRRSLALFNGAPKRFAENLYDPKKQLEELLKRDAKVFQDAFTASVRGVTKIKDEWWEPNTEPLGRLANKYMAPLNAFDALTELDIEDRENAALFRAPALFPFGLRPLADGLVVKRSEWEVRNEGGDSIYQKTATLLEQGETQSYSHSQINSMLEQFKIK